MTLLRALRALLPAVLAVTGLLGTSSPAGASPASVTQDLRTRLHAAIAKSTATTVSVAVDVDGLGSVYRQGATAALPPASTEKLYTTFAALQALGPAARLRTELRATYAQRGPYLPGNLYVVAGGDPYLTAGQLDALAGKIRSAGIRRIEGSLVVDDLRYDAVRRAPGWKTSYVPDESGPLSALAVDGNRWRRDNAYLADPAIPTLDRFRRMLAQHGVSVSAALHRGRTPAAARLVASHVSASLTDLVRKIAKDSDNFAAELLLKEAGLAVRGAGSTAAGAAAVRDLLTPLGVGVGTVADGSGLSSRDRQTAAGELSLLKGAEATESYTALRRSLPVACQDGTLEKRMCGTAAAGKAIGKTGTLPSTHSLTGWTTTADGHLVRYAILLAGTTSTAKARAAIDACVVLLSAARVAA
jgi:D-alanyl-D-alanine carboxypeptidase/D-alanyl-D-alanine-endopeptidase (penicillin-binding protein 4)